MSGRRLALVVLPDLFAICRLAPGIPVPLWATQGSWFSITRTTDELSVACPQTHVPRDVACERDWKCLRVAGTLALSELGVLASLTTPLADAGISVFAVSTFDTDYLLVKETDLERTLASLRQAGHSIAT